MSLWTSLGREEEYSHLFRWANKVIVYICMEKYSGVFRLTDKIIEYSSREERYSDDVYITDKEFIVYVSRGEE